jgi:LytS/YehU family sensor histidine kinase
MIVKLGDMMRYLLHESNAAQVPLEKEVQYVRHYTELHSLKQRWQPKITLQQQGAMAERQLAPLLFINFVENAFKHSNLDDEGAFVHISITATDDAIRLCVANSYAANSRKDNTQGIGLANVRQRLQLLYPGKHSLQVQDDGTVYQVELCVNDGA